MKRLHEENTQAMKHLRSVCAEHKETCSCAACCYAFATPPKPLKKGTR